VTLQIKLRTWKWVGHTTEEGFFCHRRISFELEPPRTRKKIKTHKDLKKKERGES
jgi:hypothetical protein